MSEDKRLLIIDADLAICYVVKQVAEGLGYTVRVCRDPQQFRRRAGDWRPTTIMVDLRFIGTENLELLRHLAALRCPAAVIINCGHDMKLLAAATQLAADGGLDLGGVLQHPLCRERLQDMLSAAGQRGVKSQLVANQSDVHAELALQHA